MQTISDELSRLQVIELDAGQIFSGNPSGTPIKGYATPSLYTPRLDPNYLFHESSRDIIVWLLLVIEADQENEEIVEHKCRACDELSVVGRLVLLRLTTAVNILPIGMCRHRFSRRSRSTWTEKTACRTKCQPHV